MKQKNVSMQKISEVTGVSVATVSRVINQNGRFSKETEERVRKALEEYQYTPNLAARGLRTKRMATVGVIVPDITNEYFATVTLEIQKRLFEAHYSTIICNTDENLDIEKKHLRMLQSHQVSGVIYIAGSAAEPYDILDFPTVFIDRQPHSKSRIKDCFLIESDNVNGGYLATRELIQKGCTRIAMMKYKADVSSHNDREKGYMKALHEAGLDQAYCRIAIAGQVDVNTGYELARELLGESRFDGLFCSADFLAVGAQQAVLEQGLAIPGQVKVIGFDDVSMTRFCRVPLSSVRQSVEDISRLAVDNLLNMIKGGKIDRRHHVLPIRVIPRASTE